MLGFQLKTGHSPHVIPPLVPYVLNKDEVDEVERAKQLLDCLADDVQEAKDNLLQAKVLQAAQANKHHGAEVVYSVDDRVMLSTFHRHREYVQKGDKWVAKFMPRYDGPYNIAHAHPERLVYMLHMPNLPELYLSFHASLLTLYHENDAGLFPGHVCIHPGTIVTEDGEVEWWVDRILDERKQG